MEFFNGPRWTRVSKNVGQFFIRPFLGILLEHYQNDTNHHRRDRRWCYANDEKFFWVLISLFSVVPIIVLLLKIRRKLSERCESHQERGRSSRDITTPSEVRLSDSVSVYSITKQDYVNLAPPRYSVISQNPVPTTYEKPPPYSPTPGR